MKCPKCGYHSFEHLDSCKKCSADLSEHKAKFSIKGFFSPGQTEPEPDLAGADEAAAEAAAAENGDVDFGFDFLDEEGEAPVAEPVTEQAAPPTEASSDELAGAFDESDDQTEEGADDGLSLGDDDQVSIDQPFGIDSETVPADDVDADDDEKKGPDSEFSF